MNWNVCKLPLLRLAASALVACGWGVHTAQAATQSVEVAYLGSLTIQNGGVLPGVQTPVPAEFTAFSFHQVTRANLSLANLGAGGVCGATRCDTLVLNVASAGAAGLACNTGNLSAQQKLDIVTFVSQGGKLIIYDSECTPQNYGWLPYPFTTSNPGATGSMTGLLTIVEDNVLSSPVAADTHYINAALMTSQTDAVGDMNVMVTRDANWCLDMSGTNVRNVTGPVHTYARYGAGLIIYNGMDIDFLTGTRAPSAATGPGNLSKVWLQELQAPFDPVPLAALPCGATVVGLNLSPAVATNNLSLGQTSHTVTASLKDLLNNPEPGHFMTFTVLTGPNAGTAGVCTPSTCFSDSNGLVSFVYLSNGLVGTDTIQACTQDNVGQTLCSQVVTKNWIRTLLACDVDLDGDIDQRDLALISRARGQRANPAGDPRDADGDGLITPNDVKVCLTRCTRASCAVQ
jgi:hypothetical protein